MLRKTFGPNKEEVIDRRQLRDWELRDFYFSSNISRVITLRRVMLAGHVAPMGRTEIQRDF